MGVLTVSKRACTSRQSYVAVVMAALTLALTAGTARASSSLPTMLSRITGSGTYVVAIRPRVVVTDSADGGELRLHWTRWSRSGGAGYGTAHPDHGSYAIRVTVGRPVQEVFTRMTIFTRQNGRVHADRMAMAYLGDVLSWIRVSWMRNPASGAIPWNGAE
jgi:hypothetical protein